MAHPDDIAYLRDEMSPAVFEALIHDWAKRLREAQRDVETRMGPGNGEVSIRQELKSGHPTKTWMVQPDKCYEKRNGTG